MIIFELLLLSFLIGSLKSDTTAPSFSTGRCTLNFFKAMRFTDDAKPLLEASVDPTKEAPCAEMCQNNPDCYAYDYIPGHCRFYQIETGKNLTFGFDSSCKGESLLLGIKVDLRPGEMCYEFLLLDLWESNQTRPLKNGKNYGLREVGEAVYQIYSE
ncbi:hypothetical protein B9Z55_020587 [Caenorhabditis nigoni]|uniref:Apple domain-containing protein n=2 Tax=Caenorhabditis nigoni TaxID=1611254 RepID=A0A2G5TNW7_9PELO|nr:hypothetical protein B9Z55_020587 [Caenorhabditis nigoni]